MYSDWFAESILSGEYHKNVVSSGNKIVFFLFVLLFATGI